MDNDDLGVQRASFKRSATLILPVKQYAKRIRHGEPVASSSTSGACPRMPTPTLRNNKAVDSPEPLEEYECPICNKDLSSLNSVYLREKHVGNCLKNQAEEARSTTPDGQQRQISSSSEDANYVLAKQLHTAVDSFGNVCVFCGRLLSEMTLIDKTGHIYTCLDALISNGPAELCPNRELNKGYKGLVDVRSCPICNACSDVFVEGTFAKKAMHLRNCSKRHNIGRLKLWDLLQKSIIVSASLQPIDGTPGPEHSSDSTDSKSLSPANNESSLDDNRSPQLSPLQSNRSLTIAEAESRHRSTIEGRAKEEETFKDIVPLEILDEDDVPNSTEDTAVKTKHERGNEQHCKKSTSLKDNNLGEDMYEIKQEWRSYLDEVKCDDEYRSAGSSPESYEKYLSDGETDVAEGSRMHSISETVGNSERVPTESRKSLLTTEKTSLKDQYPGDDDEIAVLDDVNGIDSDSSCKAAKRSSKLEEKVQLMHLFGSIIGLPSSEADSRNSSQESVVSLRKSAMDIAGNQKIRHLALLTLDKLLFSSNFSLEAVYKFPGQTPGNCSGDNQQVPAWLENEIASVTDMIRDMQLIEHRTSLYWVFDEYNADKNTAIAIKRLKELDIRLAKTLCVLNILRPWDSVNIGGNISETDSRSSITLSTSTEDQSSTSAVTMSGTPSVHDPVTEHLASSFSVIDLTDDTPETHHLTFSSPLTQNPLSNRTKVVESAVDDDVETSSLDSSEHHPLRIPDNASVYSISDDESASFSSQHELDAIPPSDLDESVISDDESTCQTSCITPDINSAPAQPGLSKNMPDYRSMSTFELEAAVSKYGLKPASDEVMVQILEKIWIRKHATDKTASSISIQSNTPKTVHTNSDAISKQKSSSTTENEKHIMKQIRARKPLWERLQRFEQTANAEGEKSQFSRFLSEHRFLNGSQ